MVNRTIALCKGKIIGIETIYTVIDGRQINIPEKLEELREKSRRNELFCPCRCGTNLILVASDKGLKRQHFREKNGTGKCKCTMLSESENSIESKIVLKCWLDDKLTTNDIETRVAIDTVETSKRKPEFTLLSSSNKFAIRYWNERSNIANDKIDILEGNLSGIRVLYIVDELNGGCNGQYPEALMKLQNKQKYCLLLKINEIKYDKASMRAVFYAKDIDGLWNEITFTKGLLKDYSINEDNDIIYFGKSLSELYEDANSEFNSNIEKERERRINEEEKRKEYLQKQKEEEEQRKLEIQRQREKLEKQQRLDLEKKEEKFKESIKSQLSQQGHPVIDMHNNRWIKCEFCGKIAMEKEFNSYGGKDHINLGTCKQCSDGNPSVNKKSEEIIMQINEKQNQKRCCPICGEKLVVRNGIYGKFFGCNGFPNCNYTQNIKR